MARDLFQEAGIAQQPPVSGHRLVYDDESNTAGGHLVFDDLIPKNSQAKPWEQDWSGKQGKPAPSYLSETEVFGPDKAPQMPWEKDWGNDTVANAGAFADLIPAKGNVRTWGEAAADTGIDLAKGAVGLGESLIGLADLATGNLVGKGWSELGYDPARTKQMLSEGYSDARQNANLKVANAEGFMDKAMALIDNPSAAVGSMVESTPMMLGSAGAVRAVATKMLASRGLVAGSAEAAAFLRSPAVIARLTAIGSATEGAMTAGNIQEQGRQAGRDYTDTAPAAVAGGALTAAIGFGTSKIPGFKDAEVGAALAGMGNTQRQGLITAGKEIARGVFKEGVLEELPQSAQEQAFTNLALGKPWYEGVDEAAAQGMIAGAGMGGGMTTYSAGRDALAGRPRTAAPDNAKNQPPALATQGPAATNSGALNTPKNQPVDVQTPAAPRPEVRLAELELTSEHRSLTDAEVSEAQSLVSALQAESAATTDTPPQFEDVPDFGATSPAAAPAAAPAPAAAQQAASRADVPAQEGAENGPPAHVSIAPEAINSEVPAMPRPYWEGFQSGDRVQTPHGVTGTLKISDDKHLAYLVHDKNPDGSPNTDSGMFSVTPQEVAKIQQAAPAAPAAPAMATKPPANFWAFAQARGIAPGSLQVGSPEWQAVKNEFESTRAGLTPPAPAAEATQPAPEPRIELQNRDRSRAASVVQMQDIAKNPDYMRLGTSRTPDSGAPMVFPVGDDGRNIPDTNLGHEDMAVMSDGQRVPFVYAVVTANQVNASNFSDGNLNPAYDSKDPGTLKALNNGRTAGLQAAYMRGKAEKYKAELLADVANHGVPAEVINRTLNPMLVRLYRDADNTPGMAAKSQGQGLSMAPGELARQDAPLLDATVLTAYRNGDITSAANRGFVRAFIGKLRHHGQDVAAMMTADGQLSPAGRTRIQAALVQAAYGDSDLVNEMFDSQDSDIKAIGTALKTVAGQWADMRDSARMGAIDAQVDITGNLVQAVNLIRKARQENTALAELAAQRDLLTGQSPDPITVALLRFFYKGDAALSLALGADKVVTKLNAYLQAAMGTSSGAGMFDDAVTVDRILQSINNQGSYGTQQTQNSGAGTGGGSHPGLDLDAGRQLRDGASWPGAGGTGASAREVEEVTQRPEIEKAGSAPAPSNQEGGEGNAPGQERAGQRSQQHSSPVGDSTSPTPDGKNAAIIEPPAAETAKVLAVGDAVSWQSKGKTAFGEVVRAPDARGATTVRATGAEAGAGVKAGAVFSVPATAISRMPTAERVIDGFKAGDIVDVEGRTISNWAVKEVFMDESPLGREQPWVGMATVVSPAGKELKVLSADLRKAASQKPANDRDHFTLTRLNQETRKMEPITFARGEFVRHKLGTGEIDGISQSKQEFSVEGLWYPFGYAYKAERPEAPKPDTIPMSTAIDAVNKKNGQGLTDADLVPTTDTILDMETSLWSRIADGAATVEEFKAGFNRWISNRDMIIEAFSKKKKDDLLKLGGSMFAYRNKSENKPEIVASLWREGAGDYVLGRSLTYGMGKDSYINAVRALVDNTDADQLAQYATDRKAAQEEAAARVAKTAEAIKDPKTLDDFKTWMRATMSGGKTFKEARMLLTPEQRAQFDDMVATESRTGRKTRTDNQRTSVSTTGQAVESSIIATKHTKKGHDLFVVKLGERVSKDDYSILLAGAKRIGGYYSAFRGAGAIPGFQFTERSQAEAFEKLAKGDSTAAQEAAQATRDAFTDDRSQTAVQRLTEMADRLEGQADASLNQERKQNTDKRARQAASAEAAANAEKAMAKTMRNLAQAIGNGSAKFLDRVRQKTQVSMLLTAVNNAKYDELRTKYPSYAEQEKHKGEPATNETADYAEYPTFTAYRSDLASLARQLVEVDGTKKLGQQLLKVADDVSDAYLTFAKENFSQVASFTKTGGGIAGFSTKDAAEAAIARSGYKGKAIAYQVKRGEHAVIMSPSEAIERGIWKGDGDKRITLSGEFGAELVEKIGKAARRGSKVSVPWQFETSLDRRNALERMGIETPAEYRAALREFIGLQEVAEAPSKVKQLERAMVGRRNDGMDFFPTPESVADEMVETAGIKPGMAVLEPSAGWGHIAERIRAAGVDPDVGEMSGDRRELLEAKGFRLVSGDFMALNPREFFTYGDTFKAKDGTEGMMRGAGGLGSNRVKLVDADGNGNYHDRDELTGTQKNGGDSGYDRILMNPPFSDGRDIQHVQHAYSLLRPGGRIVAIMGESAFTSQNKRASEFREWLDSMGGTSEKLPDGSFKDSSLPVNTGANARMVVIDKETDKGVAMFSRTQSADDAGPEHNALRALSQTDELFALPKSDKDTVEGIAADTDPGITVKPLNHPGLVQTYVLTMPNGARAKLMVRQTNPYGAQTYGMLDRDDVDMEVITDRPGENAESIPDGTEDVYVDVSALKEGGDGRMIYNIAATFAHNTGRILIGDPAGLSDIAMRRRTEHMLSSALKFGTTRHLAPHPRQTMGAYGSGVPPLRWTYGDDVSNIKSLIQTSLKSLDHADGNPFTFDAQDGTFRDSEGRVADDDAIQLVADKPGSARPGNAGSTTYKRSAVLSALLRQQSQEGRAGRSGVGILGRLLEVGRQFPVSSQGIFYSKGRGASSSGLTAQQITGIVDAIRARWANAPDVVVLASMDDAPAAVRKEYERQNSKGASGSTEGFFYGGKVYLVADQLATPTDAMRVLFHETLGHMGLRGVFGDSLKPILQGIIVARRPEVTAKAKQYGLDMANPDDALAAAEEVLAGMAQDKPELGFVKRAIAAIRTWLRANVPGFKDMHLSDAEIIASYILPARAFVQGGQGRADGALSFSRGIQTGSAAFKAWFGDSKVVDNDGQPLVVYHGTIVRPDSARVKGMGDINVFDRMFTTQFRRPSIDTVGSWFSTNPGDGGAEMYSGNGSGSAIYPVYLSIKNPQVTTFQLMTSRARKLHNGKDDGRQIGAEEVAAYRKWLEAMGKDGIKIEASGNDGSTEFDQQAAWIALEPTQIKSATGNNGDFDSTNPDIRFSRNSLGNKPIPPVTGAQANAWTMAKAKVMKLTSPEFIDKLIYEFQDKFTDLKNLRAHIQELGGTITDLNDSYQGEELYHSRLAKRNADFLDKELKPLLADMRSRAVSKEELENYLHARHAPEANAAMAERNPTRQMIDDGRTKATKDVKELELKLQHARNNHSATKAIEDALIEARGELAKWHGAQAFKGTEAARTSLSGMTDIDAKAFMDSLTPRQLENLKDLAVRVDAIQAETLDTLERYGLMDRASLTSWRKAYRHYVPLHRDEARPETGSHPIGQGFSVKGNASKQRTGSTEKVTNILAHIAMQREAALTRGEKNHVVKKLYLMAAQNPDKDFWEVDAPPMIKTIDSRTGFVRTLVDPQFKNLPNVVMVRIAGNDQAIVFNEHNKQAKRLAEAIKNIDVGDLHVVLGLAAKGTRWFASINTQYNPIFGLVNFARDVQSGLLNLTTTPLAGKQKEVAANIPAAMRAIYRERRGKSAASVEWARLWDEYQTVGGITGYKDMFADVEDRAKALTRELEALDRGKVSKAAHAIVDWLSDYNEAMENSVRLAAYKQALDQGISKERAASLAKNLTVNFNRKGRQAREIGALYAFFNASIQGTARMAETLKGPVGKRIMYGGVLLGVVNTLIGMAVMGGDDDDAWEQVPEFIKERSIVIPIGHQDYLTIPMPLGFHVFPNIGRIATEFALGGQDKTLGRQLGKLLMATMDSFNPLGGSQNLGQLVAPTVIDPVVALMENKDWTGRPIYRENANGLDPQPGHTMAKDSASSPSRFIAKQVNRITGGTEYRPGAWSPTPDQLDYVIGQLTGGLGRELLKANQTVVAAATGDELPPYKVPLLGRLYGNTRGPSGQSGQYYANVKTLNEIENEVKGRLRNSEDVEGYQKGEPLSQLVQRGNVAERHISKIRKVRRIVVEKAEPGYQERVKELDKLIGETMADLNREVTKARRKADEQ